MANGSAPRKTDQQNGHPTVARGVPATGSDQAEAEPKGLPTSDRYYAETVHAAESDDHTKLTKKDHKK